MTSFLVRCRENTGNFSLGHVSYNSIGEKNSLVEALSARNFGPGSPFATLKNGARYDILVVHL